MNIYPAIDLISGRCVRLVQGRFDQMTVYENNPVKIAKLFASQGAKWLHVVDLDGAKRGCSINLDTIINIKRETELQIQMGGGIRCREQIRKILSQGIDRIILGSVAISQANEVKTWLEEFGCERIVLALDVRVDELGEPKLASHGWEQENHQSLWELLDEYQDSSVQHVLCTDIQRDGTLQGPNLNLYRECVKRYPEILFQASGGVGSLADLSALSVISVADAIVGKSLYENKFSLIDALRSVH